MINMSLRLERLRRGWSQQQLADFSQVSLSTIVRAEHGQSIRIDCIQQIAECLEKTPEQLELLKVKLKSEKAHTEAVSEQDKPLEQEEANMDRREATKTIGKFVVGATLLATSQPLEQLATLLKPDTIDSQTLEYFAKLTDICWKLSNGNELETAGSILECYLTKVIRFAQHDSPHQKVAAEIAAQGLLLSASLASHKDDLNGRQRYSEEAFRYGQLAQNTNLQVTALKQLAIAYDYKQRPGKALQTYQQCIPYLDDISPLIRTGTCVRMAGAYAQCGQGQEALSLLGKAHDSFPDRPENDPGFLYADSGYYSLLLWDGLIHLDLDRPKEAEKAFMRVDGFSPKIDVPERVRIEFLIYQATTSLVLRNLEQSCFYLEAATKASLALGSERRYSESFDAYQQMRRVWMHEPAIKALGDMFMR